MNKGRTEAAAGGNPAVGAGKTGRGAGEGVSAERNPPPLPRLSR